jgi:hypothetical protein
MGISNIDSDLWRLGTMIFGAFLSFLAAWALYRIQDIRKKRVNHEDRLTSLESTVKALETAKDSNIKRLNGIESENREVLKVEIEKGGFMTTKDHADICATAREAIAQVVDQRLISLEKNLDLKLENLRLTMLVNGNSKHSVKKNK